MIIADTNLVSYLLIEGERTVAVRRVHEKDPDWKLPTLWRSEFLNVFTVVAVTTDAGGLFQILAARTGKARWPTVDSRVRGTNSFMVDAELR